MNKTQMQEESMQEMETKTDDPRRIQRHCASMLGRGEKNQRLSGVKPHEVCECQQESLPLIYI